MTDLTDVLLGALVLIGSQLLIKLATQRIEGAPGRAQRAVQSDVELYNSLPQDLKEGPEGVALRERLTERLAQLTAAPPEYTADMHAERYDLSIVEVSFPLSVLVGVVVAGLTGLFSGDRELGLSVGTTAVFVVFFGCLLVAAWSLVRRRRHRE